MKLNFEHYDHQIKTILAGDKCEQRLEQLVVELLAGKYSKAEIYDLFHQFHVKYRNQPQYEALVEHYIDDILDRLSGYYVGKNF